MKKRHRWVLISATATLLLGVAYCSAYLALRKSHRFIHRAGYYSDPRGNHYIELGAFLDGPQMFGFAVMGAAAEGSGVDYSKVEENLQFMAEQQDKERKLWSAIFYLFVPLAAIESSYWKLINPYPLLSK